MTTETNSASKHEQAPPREQSKIMGWVSDWWSPSLLTFGLVMVFAQTGMTPSNDRLFDLGATSHQALGNGELWRLMTAPLLHGSLRHLFQNALFVLVMGMAVRSMAGSAAFFVVFAFSGMIGAFASALLHFDNTISVGASGAVLGLLGFLHVYGVHSTNELKIRALVFGTYTAINLLAPIISKQIDFWAHLGGFLTGLVLAIAYNRKPASWFQQGMAIFAITSIFLGFVFVEVRTASAARIYCMPVLGNFVKINRENVKPGALGVVECPENYLSFPEEK